MIELGEPPPSSAPARAGRRRRRIHACRSTPRAGRAPTRGPPGGRRAPAPPWRRARPSPAGSRAARAAWRCRGRDSTCERGSPRGVAYGRMRVVLADPPAFTPAYDHELAAALARAGVDVELVTSHFRFGDSPQPDGYVRRELFYPLSSRLFQRSRLRLPLKVAEHPFGLAALRAQRTDVLHLQWLVPEIDVRLFRPTRHRSSPRTTCCPAGRRPSRGSGSGSSGASTASSCTANAGARHLRTSA